MARPSGAYEYCGWLGDSSIYKYSSEMRDLENRFLSYLRTLGIAATVTSRLRTCDQQLALYQAGKTTAAPTTSQHEFGLAFDLVPTAGFQRYGATFAQTVKWLVDLSVATGYSGLAEGDHAHIEYWPNATWRKMIVARDVVFSLPVPSKTPKPKP